MLSPKEAEVQFVNMLLLKLMVYSEKNDLVNTALSFLKGLVPYLFTFLTDQLFYILCIC